MDSKEVIKRIINVPWKYLFWGDDICDQLKVSGYYEVKDYISEHDIAETLKNFDGTDNWLEWSRRKQPSTGWFFKKKSDSEYIVGYYPFNSSKHCKLFSNGAEACAYFIKNEVESVCTQ